MLQTLFKKILFSQLIGTSERIPINSKIHMNS